MGTLGSAVWARFSVQSGLAYELDTRQIPGNWSTGYWALGTKAPGQLPQVSGSSRARGPGAHGFLPARTRTALRGSCTVSDCRSRPMQTSDLYGTEVFELNTNLLARAVNITSGLKLNDSSVAQQYRSRFSYAPANQPPTVTQGDACAFGLFLLPLRFPIRPLISNARVFGLQPLQSLLGRVLCRKPPRRDLGQLYEFHDQGAGQICHHRSGGQCHPRSTFRGGARLPLRPTLTHTVFGPVCRLWSAVRSTNLCEALEVRQN